MVFLFEGLFLVFFFLEFFNSFFLLNMYIKIIEILRISKNKYYLLYGVVFLKCV